MLPAEKRLRARLAANLRRLREEQDLTIEESAHRAKLHPRHWQKLEAGAVNVTINTLARIAEVFGVPVLKLLE